MDDTPNSIMPILDTSVKPIDPFSATTAVFYSISNCQMGLKSVSFGSFLIKQVVTEIEKEFKQIKHFVTLSPVPGLKKWSNKINLLEDKDLPENIINDISECCKDNKPNPLVLNRLAYYYLTQVKRKNGQAINPVAHFHLGNGASLYKIHTDANVNQSALDDSWGVMVNYLYDLESVAKNHEDYANQEPVAVSPKLTKSIQNNKKKILAYWFIDSISFSGSVDILNLLAKNQINPTPSAHQIICHAQIDGIPRIHEGAQIEAGRLKEERGESVPCRNH